VKPVSIDDFAVLGVGDFVTIELSLNTKKNVMTAEVLHSFCDVIYGRSLGKK
jgi:hypothetical protein